MNATIVEYVNGMEVISMFNQTASSMGRFQVERYLKGAGYHDRMV
ncbi:MAG: hypothetical protein ACLU3I_06575 [Acutalibacteraceae bacterium]